MKSDLFTQTPNAPLAERLRPQSLAQMLGQQHLIGIGQALYTALESGIPHSMIFWGAPGTGKTTLARILAQGFNAQFLSLSAVFSGVKEIREAIVQAQIAWQQGKRTILFIDEVHRFNKAQQDAFLPHLENGLITFIGATTENPSFEINPALLSRTQVYVLKPLNNEELMQLFARITNLPEYAHFTFSQNAYDLLIHNANGDARKLLNQVEQLLIAANIHHHKHINSNFVAQHLSEQLRSLDKKGDQFHNQISALHKSIRGSHPNAALYWLCRMLDGGVDPHYLARRIIRTAWEDIGLADPRAFHIAQDAAAAYERLGSPEGELALAQAVLYLATAPKSNSGYVAYNKMCEFIRQRGNDPVPAHLCNAPTDLMNKLGYGKNYRYAHDEPHAYASGETYMPDNINEPIFYQPSKRGLEIQIAERLAWLNELDKKAKK